MNIDLQMVIELSRPFSHASLEKGGDIFLSTRKIELGFEKKEP